MPRPRAAEMREIAVRSGLACQEVAFSFHRVGSGPMPPTDDSPPRNDARPRPFADSLCWGCANRREVRGARSVFLMCEGLPVKYPRQPVVTCPAFLPAA